MYSFSYFTSAICVICDLISKVIILDNCIWNISL